MRKQAEDEIFAAINGRPPQHKRYDGDISCNTHGGLGYFGKLMKSKSGLTLLELLVVCALMGVLAGIVALNLRGLSVDADNDTSRFAAFARQVRVRAMATTSAYRIIKSSNTSFTSQWNTTCTPSVSSPWTADDALTLTLAEGVSITNITNGTSVVCYSSRGLADASRTVTFKDKKNKQRSAVIYMGGGVDIQ